ncbi:hypothetical protein QC764_202080 [Podospora pseudoanserina]|uniref:Zn(2)-C6 fungal-type domain-containing protein n=1 Tax=Podospora pseudoanserina TaxID=2609844 RepID=A0ABR0IGF4_9PEZI|nr:hypothetical protein QC764_202080 [Podospora pseudoanserina]
MRHTLRRSCSACAKSKHSCDLGTPRCSRCVKRKVQCLYANEPLTAPQKKTIILPVGTRFSSVDPFESYPQTRLPRSHVQRLIHSFLHKIAFQYYPLDLSPTSNPFLVSWWPQALGDPALFHVSLQTACLDEELLAQRGFQASTVLMADSVALLRRKVEDSALAVQDGTMNSVITLAAIEFGKGNTRVSEMHVAGVKRLVDLRGGISSVRRTSPLTARMVSWVSLLVMGHPQFDTQDDAGIGDGIPPIPEWRLDLPILEDQLGNLNIDHPVKNVLTRLRCVFERAQSAPFPNTRLHDLTCFAVHRLLLTAAGAHVSSPTTECIRYGIVLYMFIIQGPTYFSHAVLMNKLVTNLRQHLEQQQFEFAAHQDVNVWLAAVGLVASANNTAHYEWFAERARAASASLQLRSWTDTLSCIKRVLWLETVHSEGIFRPHWDMFFMSSHNDVATTDISQPTTPRSLVAIRSLPRGSPPGKKQSGVVTSSMDVIGFG